MFRKLEYLRKKSVDAEPAFLFLYSLLNFPWELIANLSCQLLIPSNTSFQECQWPAGLGPKSM